MSAIFYHDEEQKLLAQSTKSEEQKKRSTPIKTSILPATVFYVAEE